MVMVDTLSPFSPSRGETIQRFSAQTAHARAVRAAAFGLANAGVPFEQVGPGTDFVREVLPECGGSDRPARRAESAPDSSFTHSWR
jgi:hypothetical protein